MELARLWKTPASHAGGGRSGGRRACWPAEKVEDTIGGGHGYGRGWASRKSFDGDGEERGSGRASGDGRQRRGAPALIGQVATGKYDACGV